MLSFSFPIGLTRGPAASRLIRKVMSSTLRKAFDQALASARARIASTIRDYMFVPSSPSIFFLLWETLMRQPFGGQAENEYHRRRLGLVFLHRSVCVRVCVCVCVCVRVCARVRGCACACVCVF